MRTDVIGHITEKSINYDPDGGMTMHWTVESPKMSESYFKELKSITSEEFDFHRAITKGFFPTNMNIKNVEFNPPLTIVIWEDGSKTFVKCDESDKYDPEKGLAMAIAKKVLGNKCKSTKIISDWVDKKWLKEDK